MAVERVTEIASGRSGPVDEQAGRKYTKVYRVECTVATDGPITAVLALPVRRNDYYVEASGFEDRGALAVSVDPQPESPDENFNWTVTVNYTSFAWDEVERALFSGGAGGTGSPPSSPQQGGQTDQSPANPLLRPSSIRWGTMKGKRVMEKDASIQPDNGIAVVNSAGDRYDPPYERDETYITLTITRNEGSYDAEGASQYFDKLNEETFLGFGVGLVKCEGITAVSQFENSFLFWEVTYDFTIRPDGWDLIVLDVGLNEKFNDGGTDKRRAILDANGLAVSSPVMLDGLGAKQGYPITAEYRTFKPYHKIDFGALELP